MVGSNACWRRTRFRRANLRHKAVRADPETAAQWVEQVADPGLRSETAKTVFARWTIQDPVAARAWLRDLSGVEEGLFAKNYATPDEPSSSSYLSSARARGWRGRWEFPTGTTEIGESAFGLAFRSRRAGLGARGRCRCAPGVPGDEAESAESFLRFISPSLSCSVLSCSKPCAKSRLRSCRG